MNTKELASLYGVSPTTFRKWLKPIEHKVGQRIGYIWSPKQVRIIHHNLCGVNGTTKEVEEFQLCS